MPIRTPSTTIVSNDDPGVAKQVSKSLSYQAEIRTEAAEVSSLDGVVTYYDSVAVQTDENTVSVVQSSENTDSVVSVYNTDKDIYVNNFSQNYTQNYTPSDGGDGVQQVIAGSNIEITSTGPGGTGIVTVNSTAISGNPFNQDLNTYDTVAFDGATITDTLGVNLSSTTAGQSKILLSKNYGSAAGQSYPLGSVAFGGSYNSTGSITYSASIGAYADGAWTSETSAPAGVVIRTGSTGSSGASTPLNFQSWVGLYGDITIDTNDDYPSSVAYDSSGNVYIVGADGYNGYVRFVAKFNSAGALVWQKKIVESSTLYYSSGDGITVDGSGNIIITLNLYDSVSAAVVIKLDQNGNIIWTRQIDSSVAVTPQLSNAGLYDVTTDSAGNIYACGSIRNVDLGLDECFLVKLDTSGSVLWQRRMSTARNLWSVKCDPSGNVYVVGETSETGTVITNTDVYKLLLAKYDSSGVQLWRNITSHTTTDNIVLRGMGLALDSANNIIVGARCANYSGSGSFGLVVKFNNSGNQQWQRYIASGVAYYGVAVDSSDNIYVSGSTYIDASQGDDVIAVKYSSNGILQWQRSLGSSGDEYLWYFNGLKNIAVHGDSYAITGYAYTGGSYSNCMVAQLKLDGSDIDSYGQFNYKQTSFPEFAGTYVTEFLSTSIFDAATQNSTPGYQALDNDYEYNLNYGSNSLDNIGGDAVYISSNRKVGIGTKPTAADLTTNNKILINGLYIGSRGENTFVGRDLSAGTGYLNTCVGTNSLNNLTSAWNNTSIGHQNLQQVTTAGWNTAIGSSILRLTTSGMNNVGIGVNVLNNNTTGGGNIGIGTQVMYYNTTGFYNTAFGIGVLNENTTGWDNFAVGYQSMTKNTTGSNNISLGYQAMNNNTSGFLNVALGFNALYNNLTGAGHFAAGSNTLLTTQQSYDNIAIGNSSLKFTTTGGHNVGLGYQALTNNTTGAFNIAFSYNALRSNTTGNDNIGIGGSTLENNTTGLENIAIGSRSLLSNISGFRNIGIGTYPLVYNTTGSDNIGIGIGALRFNTTSSNNIAVGVSALEKQTTGYENVGVGYLALNNNVTGYQNTSMGSYSMRLMTGYRNTGFGTVTLENTSTGINNTAIGYAAGRNVTTGSNNLFVGQSAGTDAVANISTQSNYIVLGNNSTTNANIKVSWTVTSDKRDKTDISDLNLGLDFVNSLRPKKFKLMDRETGQPITEFRYGFLSQDILESEGAQPVLVDDTDSENLKLKESMIIPILTKAIQELTAEVNKLKAQLEEIRK
jgi:hypothetical protein